MPKLKLTDIFSVLATTANSTDSRVLSRSRSATTHTRSRTTSCEQASLRASLRPTIFRTWSPATVLSIGSSGSIAILAVAVTQPMDTSTARVRFTRTCTSPSTPRSTRSSWRVAAQSESRPFLPSRSLPPRTTAAPSGLGSRSLFPEAPSVRLSFSSALVSETRRSSERLVSSLSSTSPVWV